MTSQKHGRPTEVFYEPPPKEDNIDRGVTFEELTMLRLLKVRGEAQ